MTTKRVLIVGAGIAGLTLGAALRGGGWRVDQLERESDWRRPGAGLALWPNALRALRTLGLADAIERTGAILRHFSYLSEHGDVLCEIDLSALWTGLGPSIGIARDALHAVLRSGAGECQLGAPVGEIPRDYDLVVGADGINSAVRRAVADGLEPVYGGQMVWRGLAPVRSDGVRFWLGADRFFGLCPVGEELTYGFGNVAGPRLADPVAGRRERLAERFAGFDAPVRKFLDAIEDDADVHCGAIEWLPDVAWRRGNVVLIGDAAHAMSPMMGQGGCLAIEDAVVLAEELSRGDDISAALTAFVRRRQPRVAWVREQSQALGELVRLPAPVRDRALRERGASAFVERYRPLLAEP